jgi:hypothetical protein
MQFAGHNSAAIVEVVRDESGGSRERMIPQLMSGFFTK